MRRAVVFSWLALLAFAPEPGAAVERTNEWAVRVDSRIDSSPAISRDGTIYFGTRTGTLWALRPDGTRKWIFRAGGEIKSSPAIANDGTVYFGSRNRKLYAVRPEGIRQWEFGTGAWVDSSPALARD